MLRKSPLKLSLRFYRRLRVYPDSRLEIRWNYQKDFEGVLLKIENAD